MRHMIEILLPVTQTLEQRVLESIRTELTHRFGGVTLHVNAPAEGQWSANGDVERERIAVVEVMTDMLDRVWWRQYRQKLERQLSQQEIIVRATRIERL